MLRRIVARTAQAFRRTIAEVDADHGHLLDPPEERQITYVINAEGKHEKEPGENFWQGNLRGPSDTYEVGWRFERMPYFLSIIFRDENQEAFAAPCKKAFEEMERAKKQKFNPSGVEAQ